MTGFGNPKSEGSGGGTSGGAMTSPKSLLGGLGGKGGFGGTTMRHAPFMMDQVQNIDLTLAYGVVAK
jgi:hypothetical protein